MNSLSAMSRSSARTASVPSGYTFQTSSSTISAMRSSPPRRAAAAAGRRPLDELERQLVTDGVGRVAPGERVEQDAAPRWPLSNSGWRTVVSPT